MPKPNPCKNRAKRNFNAPRHEKKHKKWLDRAAEAVYPPVIKSRRKTPTGGPKMKVPKFNPLAKEMATNATTYRVRVVKARKGKGAYDRKAVRS